MIKINLHDAKTQLSKLVEQAAAGTDVIILSAGKPVARLTRLPNLHRKIRFGVLKGKVTVAMDFDKPLTDDVLARFAGR